MFIILRAVSALRGPLHANLSLVCLRLGDAKHAHRYANISLVANPKCVKARYRRAMAALELGDYSAAESDLNLVLDAEPSNLAARAAMRKCRTKGSEGAGSSPDSALRGPSLHSAESTCRPNAAEQIHTLRASLLSELQLGVLDPASLRGIEEWLEADGVFAFLSSSLNQPICGICCLGQHVDPPQTVLGALCATPPPGSEADALAVRMLRSLSAQEASTLLSQTGRGRHTPLHIAAMRGSLAVVEALSDVGADVNARDCDERGPLHFAAIHGHAKVASLLLDVYCDADSQDAFSRTPLYYAGVLGHRETASLLVDRGKADQSILLHALKEKFGTHNFQLHDWPEYNGMWMTSKEGSETCVPLRPASILPQSPQQVQRAMS